MLSKGLLNDFCGLKTWPDHSYVHFSIAYEYDKNFTRVDIILHLMLPHQMQRK